MKRWNYRIFVKMGVAVLTIAVVILLISTVKKKMQWNTPSPSAGSGIVEYADLICYEGRMYYLVETPAQDAVGDKLGEVSVSWTREPWPNEEGLISASVLYLGDPVHVWEGYDPEERLCARRENGEWAYYVHEN